MNAILFLRYLKGRVLFKGVGGFTERFINLCNLNNIPIQDIKFSENSFTAECNLNDYKKLRHISKKSGVHLVLLKETGLVFDLKAKSERLGLIFGILFFIFFMALMSNFVWYIDVTGNEFVSKEDVLKTAETYGLSVGTYKPSLDEVAASNIMAKDSNGVFSWVAFNIKGSRAVIEIRESKKSIKNTSTITPSNLIADFDGIINSVEIFKGTGLVLEGMGVNSGDLLISGAEENEDLSVSFVEASGKITALRDKAMTVSYNKKVKIKRIATASTHKSLYIFGLKIPLSLKPRKDKMVFSDQAYLQYNNIRLPLGIISQTYYKVESMLRDEKEFALSSLESFSNNVYTTNKNTLILSETPSIINSSKHIIIKCIWNCLEFLGKKQEILTEN